MARDEQTDKESPGDHQTHETAPCEVQEAVVAPTHFARTWYVTSYVSLLLRLVAPLLAAAYYVWLRNQRLLVDGVRRQLVPAISSLSAVTSPSSRVLRVMRLRSRDDCGDQEQQQRVEESVTCDVLHDPGSRIRADVVFIHGLHGSLHKTWKQGLWDPTVVRAVPLERRGGGPLVEDDGGVAGLVLDVRQGHESRLASLMNDLSRQSASLPAQDHDDPPSYSPCWPRDWLPVDCPGVRVIALNYTTDPFLWRPVWVAKRIRSGMLERSREMMGHLQRIGVGANPIVWVGHSKGGVFVKQIIIDAFESGDEEVSMLCRNTRGIMFYSVPHRGSSCADINLPLLRQSVELTEVQLECPEVLSLHARFLDLVEEKHLRAEVFSFAETVQTFMSFLYLTIVTVESADAGIGDMLGMPLDHRNICKPSSRQCILYRKLTELINRTV